MRRARTSKARAPAAVPIAIPTASNARLGIIWRIAMLRRPLIERVAWILTCAVSPTILGHMLVARIITVILQIPSELRGRFVSAERLAVRCVCGYDCGRKGDQTAWTVEHRIGAMVNRVSSLINHSGPKLTVMTRSSPPLRERNGWARSPSGRSVHVSSLRGRHCCGFLKSVATLLFRWSRVKCARIRSD
jgi:hypothetical protein